MLAILDNLSMQKFVEFGDAMKFVGTSDWESSELADIFEMAELFESFAAMRLILAGPVGGAMAWIWTRGWQDAGDFGQFVDATKFLFSFFEKFSSNFGGWTQIA